MPIESVSPILPSATKKSFPPIKAGLYTVQVWDIKEILKTPYYPAGVAVPADAEKNVPFYTFEFVILNDGEFRGRRLWKDVKPVAPIPPLGGRRSAKMWEIVSAIEGHPFTYEEGKNYGKDAVNALIGRQLNVFVLQKPPKPNGKVYNDINAFTPCDSPLSLYTKEEAEQRRAELQAKDSADINVDEIPF
jgi:hypothetical protein